MAKSADATDLKYIRACYPPFLTFPNPLFYCLIHSLASTAEQRFYAQGRHKIWHNDLDFGSMLQNVVNLLICNKSFPLLFWWFSYF